MRAQRGGIPLSRRDRLSRGPRDLQRAAADDETGGDEGTGRDEIVRGSLALGGGETAEFTGKRLDFRWMFDAGTCSLRVTYDRSLCGITFEYRVAGVSDDSITLEAANPNDPGEVVSATCMRRQAVSSE